MAKLTRKNGHIAYDVHGPVDGTPLVILRGLGRTVRHWLGYERVLAKSFRVITMDLRGVGESTHQATWRTSLFDIADDLAEVLAAEKIERAHILGVSLGGMVALAMGLSHPERCLSLVTVNTSIAGLATLRITPAAIATILRGGARHDKAEVQAALVDILVGPDCSPERRQEIAEAYWALAKEQGMYPVTVAKQLVGALRFRVKAELKRLRVPTLVVYGTADRFVPHVNSRRIAGLLPNARLIAIAGAGHEVTLDRGDELASIVADWVHESERRVAT